MLNVIYMLVILDRHFLLTFQECDVVSRITIFFLHNCLPSDHNLTPLANSKRRFCPQHCTLILLTFLPYVTWFKFAACSIVVIPPVEIECVIPAGEIFTRCSRNDLSGVNPDSFDVVITDGSNCDVRMPLTNHDAYYTGVSLSGKCMNDCVSYHSTCILYPTLLHPIFISPTLPPRPSSRWLLNCVKSSSHVVGRVNGAGNESGFWPNVEWNLICRSNR